MASTWRFCSNDHGFTTIFRQDSDFSHLIICPYCDNSLWTFDSDPRRKVEGEEEDDVEEVGEDEEEEEGEEKEEGKKGAYIACQCKSCWSPFCNNCAFLSSYSGSHLRRCFIGNITVEEARKELEEARKEFEKERERRKRREKEEKARKECEAEERLIDQIDHLTF